MSQLVHTFTVESTDDIIPKAKADFGDEAMIITHKQIRPKTLTQKPLYEVVVAVDELDYQAHLQKKANEPKIDNSAAMNEILNAAKALKNSPAKNSSLNSSVNSANSARNSAVNSSLNSALNSSTARNSSINSKNDDDVILDFSDRATASRQKAYESAKTKENSLESFRQSLSEVSAEISKVANIDTPYDKKIQKFEKQINKLSEKVSLIVDMMWKDKANLGDIVIPPEFASIYKQAKKSKMKEEHLEAIMKATIENMPSSMKSNAEAVSRYFHSLLRKMLPCRVESEIKKQKILMLVGPTGVGKTTTLAKLAFRYAYGDKRYKTGIITLDTYRIGAVEQLFQYAKMMKLPIIDGIEPQDLDEAIKRLDYCEVILVDTIGNSQYDPNKLAKTKEFLSHSNAQIDVNLVISANTKLEDLMEVYKNFASFLNIDTLIITKFDETKLFGNVFSLVYDINVPMSFFSVGQEVPDDIIPANADFLVECLLKGFKERGQDE